MTQIKSQIVKSVPTTLTAAYTNATTNGATLKAVNAVGVANPATWTVASSPAGNDDWNHFGRSHHAFADSTSQTGAWGTPMTVRLEADKVLLMWLPHHQHVGGQLDQLGGNTLHTQIVRWNGSAYQCGPIVNVTLPTAAYSAISSSIWQRPGSISIDAQSNMRAYAISSTKVAVAYRFGTSFQLMRIVISGNAVDATATANLDLSGASYFNSTTPLAFDLAAVPGDANKVIVGGSNATNWLLQAYNFPDSGSITNASTVVSTGLAAGAGGVFTMAPLTKNALSGVATFVIAGTTSTFTALSIQNFSLTLATNAIAAVGTAVTVTVASGIYGIEAACLSDGNTANAAIAYINGGDYTVLNFIRQSGVSQALNSVTTTALQHSSAKVLKVVHNVGDQKAVFVGDANLAVAYNSDGVATNLIPATVSTVTTVGSTQFYPFDSRPLFSAYDSSTTIVNRVPQLLAMTGTTATSMGTLTWTGNYLPWGHNYGGHYAWSELAQCWMVGYGGRIFALSTAGVVLYEIPLYLIDPNLKYLANIQQLAVTPAGKIVGLVAANGCEPSSYYIGNRWDTSSLAGGVYSFATNAITNAADLPKARRHSTTAVTSFTGSLVVDMVLESGTEKAYGLIQNGGTVQVARFDGTSWALLGSTGITSTAGAYSVGARPNIRLIQETSDGYYRTIGSYAITSGANITYLGMTLTPQLIDSGFGSLINTGVIINATTAQTYAITRSSTTASSVLAVYDALAVTTRVYATFGGRHLTPAPYGLPVATLSTKQFSTVLATKFGATVAPCNTSSTNVTPIAYTIDSLTSGYSVAYTLTGTTGNGWINLFQTAQFNWRIFGTGISTAYQVAGIDTALFTVVLNGDSDDFYITPIAGVSIATNSSYRANDTYLIPSGYSIKLKSSLPASIDCLLTIVEEP